MGEAHEDFLSNLSRISQLTDDCLSRDRYHMYLIFANRFLVYAEAYVKIH